MDFKDLSKALHVVNGDTAAASLKVALRLSRDRVLVNEDPISCGPAPSTNDLSAWQMARESFLRAMYVDRPEYAFDQYAEISLLMNRQRLAEESRVFVWVARGIAEQLLLAWVVFLFDRLELDISKVRVICFENLRPHQRILGIGELGPEEIRECCPEPQSSEPAELAELGRVWRVYTSSNPADLADYIADESPMPSLHHAVSRLVYRYPDVNSGLSIWDEQLLRDSNDQGPKAARVIGHAISFDETLDLVGDVYLFRRLIALSSADLVSPLISVTGDPTAVRRCEVRLTSFGEKVLAGQANHVEVNGIDDWVGGVHLSGETRFAKAIDSSFQTERAEINGLIDHVRRPPASLRQARLAQGADPMVARLVAGKFGLALLT